MKITVLAVFIFALLLATNASFAALQDVKTDISLNQDKSADWIVDLYYTENVTKSDYFVIFPVEDVRIFSGDQPLNLENVKNCKVTDESVGTLIQCQGFSFDRITYKFKSLVSVSELRDFLVFRYRFPTTEQTNTFSVKVTLPLGTAMAEREKLVSTGMEPYEPDNGQQSSDGRRIFLLWTFQPKLGETFNISLIYEKLIFDIPTVDFSLFVIAAIIIVAVPFGFLYIRRRRDVKHILPVLTDSERKVVQMLIGNKKGVDQRLLVKELDYSKTKVSRIITNLVERGIAEKIAKGRTNIIKLKEVKKYQDIKETDKEKIEAKKEARLKKMLD